MFYPPYFKSCAMSLLCNLNEHGNVISIDIDRLKEQGLIDFYLPTKIGLKINNLSSIKDNFCKNNNNQQQQQHQQQQQEQQQQKKKENELFYSCSSDDNSEIKK